jgi:hypothetical protein
MIKSRQTESGVQLKTAGLLLLRDGDCRQECLLGRLFIGRIKLEQDLAAQAMEESVAPVFSCLTCEGQRLVYAGQGSRCVALPFDLGK